MLLRSLKNLPSLSSYLRLSTKVQQALANRQPVVALESTIISHGMPYPQNIETALQVEQTIQEEGAVPATICLMDGKIHVGLSAVELERLGKEGSKAIKTSRRDLPLVLSQGLLGATTVSGTMIGAHLSGIPVFATGGIGGAHRGASETWDVSADLTELGRTNVCVVCAGAKSILDLPKTLEYLETQGVPVVAYGNGGEFPAFFSPRSGLRAPWQMATPEEVARMVRASRELGMAAGQVVGVPIPEEFSKESSRVQGAIERALEEAQQQKIEGRQATPFLLKRVAEMTEGESLKANIGLVKNNARVAGQIARSLSHMQRRSYTTGGKGPLLVVGGTAMDVTSTISQEPTQLASSFPGTVATSVGGVGQNIARAAHFLGARTHLVSALGNDAFGRAIKQELHKLGMDARYLQYPGEQARTAVYNAVHQRDGELVAAVADMDINGMISAQLIGEAFDTLQPSVVGVDGNLSTLALSQTILQASYRRSTVVYEPTSVPKSAAVLNALSFIRRSETRANVNGLVAMITPNQMELARLAEQALELGLVESRPLPTTVEEIHERQHVLDAELIRDALTLDGLFPVQVIKMGSRGVAVASTAQQRPLIRHIRPLKPSLVINSNGAGDSLVGALLACLQLQGMDMSPASLDSMVERSQRASILSLESSLSVSDKLTPDLLT